MFNRRPYTEFLTLPHIFEHALPERADRPFDR